MKITRRKFITGSTAAGVLTLLPRSQATASARPDSFATLIDLQKCNGCIDYPHPLCVTSCKKGRAGSFPNPKKKHLSDYWPQKRHEDWSGKRGVIDQFTPYNWIFLQQITVGEHTVHIPRRCMHCDNPPCAKLCPFGIKHKTVEGPVYINQSLCFGGAKCRTVCPWSVPQRQAGVGIYTLWQKYLPVGGGVMYKCDLCRDHLSKGAAPHCIEACPQKAMQIGRRDMILERAYKLKQEYEGDLYGLTENGGTSTIYVSPIPFSEIDRALVSQAEEEKNKNPVRLNSPENILEKQKFWASLSLISPLAGFFAAFHFTRKKTVDGRKKP